MWTRSPAASARPSQKFNAPEPHAVPAAAKSARVGHPTAGWSRCHPGHEPRPSRKRTEERLKAGYLCPCSFFDLVLFATLDGRADEAVARATEKPPRSP